MSSTAAPLLAALAAAGAGVLVGAATVATRSVVDQAGPVSLALLRYAIGVACLLPPVLLSRRVPVAPSDRLPIALLGIGQFGVLIILLNWSLQVIPAARAALLFATMPLLTMLLAAALGSERLGRARTLGVLLTILGVAVLVAERVGQGATAPAAWLGDLAALASALVGAVCSVLYRPYLRAYPTLQLSAYAMLASVAFLAVGATLAEGFVAAPPRLTPGGWLAVLFIGLVSAVGYYLWLWALSHTSPTRVAVFLALSPFTAAALGALLLGEPVGAALAAGLVCVALGLWLAQRPGAA